MIRRWVNGTLFVAIYIKDSTSTFPGGNQLAFIRILGTLPSRAYSAPIEDLNGKGITKYSLAKIFLKRGAEDENIPFRNYKTDLDEFYLGYYILSNTLQVEASILPWSFCLGFFANKVSILTKPTKDLRMLYGRNRVCTQCSPGLKFSNVSLILDSPKKNVINCRNDECFVTGTRIRGIQSAEEFPQLSETPGEPYLISTYRQDCYEHYTLKKEEKGFANGNGCSPGFNRDPFGICRACLPENNNAYEKTNKNSDCLLFATRMITIDDYTFNIQNYTAEKYDLKTPFKGYYLEANKYINYIDDQEFMTYKNKYFRATGRTFSSVAGNNWTLASIWRGQKLPGSELCYQISNSLASDSGYSVQPSKGFRLEPMEKYPWFEVAKQQQKFPIGALNSTVCVKSCPVGKYYDFGSLSCRSCSIGCAECHQAGKCDICIPGFSKVQKPKFRALDEELIVGECEPGCQKGFYRQRFNGTCKECPNNCKLCRDRSSKELKMLSEKDREELGGVGFCLICDRRKSDGFSMIADYTTGRCIEQCTGPGRMTLSKRTDRFGHRGEEGEGGFEYQVCEVCRSQGCKLCSEMNLNSCNKCDNGLYRQMRPNGNFECASFSQLSNLRSIIVIGVLSAFISMIFLAMIIAKIVSEAIHQYRKKHKSMVSKKNHLRLAGLMNGIEDGEQDNKNFPGSLHGIAIESRAAKMKKLVVRRMRSGEYLLRKKTIAASGLS